MEKVRKPTVSGQFYDGEKTNLENRIKDCFLDKRGPKSLAKIGKGAKNIKGLVVPHAGYIYSGPIAAYSYYCVSNNGFADTFVIIGPNHTGMGSDVSIMTEGFWETPLGKVKINKILAEKLCKDVVKKDETAHMYEHSIEVQLPFLQFCADGKKFDFVPISIGLQDFKTSQEVGKILADAIKDAKNNIVIIASSDFSHVGFNYMSMPPPGMKVDKYTEKQDKLAIDKILEMNPESLIDVIRENNITMCGYGPVAAMLIASKMLEAKTVELLKYGTSYEVQPGSSCVGYGALAIY
ncbi:MAG: MEMO1 family protein [Thermoplasmatales archaeon]|nr:MAG: MEMO1 family protein [Thermoplasmatales archaeon]